jgi:hypothetical protein
MYKLLITKYKHTNNNNYFDNTYDLSNDDWSNIVCLQLNNLTPNSEGKLYYRIYTSGSFLHFELYNEIERTTLLASGVQSMNLLLFSTYANMQITGNSNSINGQLTFQRVNEQPFPELIGFIETNTGVFDWFEITQLPTDFISSLSEELFNDKNEYVASDYQINLSNIIDERSNLGLNVFDFFENDTEYIYRVVFQKDYANIRVGFIDYSSMDKNLNNDNDSQMISFTVFSAEKELGDFITNLIFTQIGYVVSSTEHDTFNQILSKFAYTFNCVLRDDLHIDESYFITYGKYPQTNWDFLKPMENESLVAIFGDLCKQLGIMFKVLPDGLIINSYQQPILQFFFKTSGDTITNIEVLNELEGNKGVDMNLQFWGMKNLEIETNNNVFYSAKLTDLVISGGGDFAPNTSQDGFINLHQAYTLYNDNQWVSRWLPNGSYPYMESNINWIEIPMYDCSISYYGSNIWTIKKTTPVRMFEEYYDNNYWCELLNYVAGQYDYLLTNLKKTKKLTIVHSDFFDISLYNKFTYDNKEWYIEKIENIDIVNETADIEVVEV